MPTSQEMSLQEYIGQLLPHHAARREFDEMQAKLERYEQREAGNEFCEAHEDWLPIEVMHSDSEGAWLCQEAWDELVADQTGG